MYFLEGIKNRLSGRLRAQLFNNVTYQFQTFVAGYGGIEEELRKQIEDRFLSLREVARQRYVEKSAQK